MTVLPLQKPLGQVIADELLTGFRKREEDDESGVSSGPSYSRPTTASRAGGSGRATPSSGRSSPSPRDTYVARKVTR